MKKPSPSEALSADASVLQPLGTEDATLPEEVNGTAEQVRGGLCIVWTRSYATPMQAPSPDAGVLDVHIIAPVASTSRHPPTSTSLPATPKKLYPIFSRSPPTPKDSSACPDEVTVEPRIAAELPRRSSPPRTLTSPPPSPTSAPSGTKDMPIVLESSPDVPVIRGPRNAAVQSSHPFFAPRRTTLAGREGTPTSLRQSLNSQLRAPFPLVQHTRGEQSVSYVPAKLAFPRRERSRARNVDMSNSDGMYMSGLPSTHDLNMQSSQYARFFRCPPSFTDTDRDRVVGSIPLSHTAHPAIKRAIDHGRSLDLSRVESTNPQQQLWADKWAPKRAEEVLGQQEHAGYLRDWLAALQLTSTAASAAQTPTESAGGRSKRKRKAKKAELAKPAVLRAVTRTRSRKRQRIDSEDEGDWIVDDENVEEETTFDYVTSEDELLLRGPASPAVTSEAGEPPPSEPDRSSEREAERRALFPRTFHRLTNTILLVGPSGCGKTAAVYACAAELGYQVFEVYPGIGKRSGANLESLVGDVGKNHTVQVGDMSPKKRRSNQVNPLLRTLAGQEMEGACRRWIASPLDPKLSLPRFAAA